MNRVGYLNWEQMKLLSKVLPKLEEWPDKKDAFTELKIKKQYVKGKN